MPELYAALAVDEARNALIFDDVLTALDAGRCPLVLSTGRFLGERFDDARLDTLFLVSPISWKGTLAQYVGRLHREHSGKREVRVYDYVDVNVPVLTRMAARRRIGYKALGYAIE